MSFDFKEPTPHVSGGGGKKMEVLDNAKNLLHGKHGKFWLIAGGATIVLALYLKNRSTTNTVSTTDTSTPSGDVTTTGYPDLTGGVGSGGGGGGGGGTFDPTSLENSISTLTQEFQTLQQQIANGTAGGAGSAAGSGTTTGTGSATSTGTAGAVGDTTNIVYTGGDHLSGIGQGTAQSVADHLNNNKGSQAGISFYDKAMKQEGTWNSQATVSNQQASYIGYVDPNSQHTGSTYVQGVGWV